MRQALPGCFIALTIALSLLSGCSVTKAELDHSEKFCADRGGLNYINKGADGVNFGCNDGTYVKGFNLQGR